MKRITIALIQYPNVLKSALYGLEEMFLLSNRLAPPERHFQPVIVDLNQTLPDEHFSIIVLPPSLGRPEIPSLMLINWLNDHHQKGTIIAASCAGAFVLAQLKGLGKRAMTTHWNLVDELQTEFPDLTVDGQKLLINHGDIISAGGLMSWIDLGLEIVRTQQSDNIMRKLGKTLVIDTATREQRYYAQFQPDFSHGDKAVIAIQHYIHQHFSSTLSVSELARKFHLTERTLHRRFSKATSLSPKQYQQKLRIQSACDTLESTGESVQQIANAVGYDDISAFRRVFIEQIGLTPKAFRQHFRRVN
jgi:transcriptional regulator GlxA family with amidase domain